MTYETLDDLPESLRDDLPDHAQKIYQIAFNSAWHQYKDRFGRRYDASVKATAHRLALLAVKNVYEQDQQSGMWLKKSF